MKNHFSRETFPFFHIEKLSKWKRVLREILLKEQTPKLQPLELMKKAFQRLQLRDVWWSYLSCYSWQTPSVLFGACQDRSVHLAAILYIKIVFCSFSCQFNLMISFNASFFFHRKSSVLNDFLQHFSRGLNRIWNLNVNLVLICKILIKT